MVKSVRVGVAAIVMRGDSVLIGRRINCRIPVDENTWSLPGGKVEFNESCAEACERELYEETGLRGRVIELYDAIDGLNVEYQTRYVTLYYLVHVSEDQEPRVTEPDQMIDWHWAPTHDLLDKYKLFCLTEAFFLPDVEIFRGLYITDTGHAVPRIQEQEKS